MIFITENDLTIKTQRLRGGYQPGGAYTFVLHNAMTNSVRTVTVEDGGDDYVMSFTIPASFAQGVQSGEYVWTVQDNSYGIVATGVARKKETRFPTDTTYSHVEPDTEYIGTDTTAIYHTVSISTSLGGYLMVDGEMFQEYTESVPEGLNLAVEAVPGQGFQFTQWSDGETDNPRTLVVDCDITLSAAFESSVQQNDEIWYTTSDGEVVSPFALNFGSGVTIVSNTYSNGKGVIKLNGDATEIGTQDFWKCDTLVSVSIPDSVTRIGMYAFANSGLSSVTFGSNVATILDQAFDGCTNLERVEIPDTVTSLGTNVFQYCTGLTSVTIGGGLSSLPDNTFRNCTSLESVFIPDNVESLGISVFRYSGLASVTFGGGITNIGNFAFANTGNLTSITFESETTVPAIGTNVFNNIASTGNVYGYVGLDYSAVMSQLPPDWVLIQS